MKTIALVTYSASPKLTLSDAFLVAPLEKEGFQTIAVPWDDHTIHWMQFDIIVLRSCWEYYRTYNKFLSWLALLEQIHANVWNPTNLVRWNSNKRYMKTLEDKGALIPPTVWLKKGDVTTLKDIILDTGWTDLIIKPTIGASAYGVYRVKPNDYKNVEPTLHHLLQTSDIMVQPLMTEVMSDGEYSCIFLGGTFSHAVRKVPPKGEFKSNYEFGSTETFVTLDDVFIKQATSVLRLVNATLLYARVDGIIHNGQFMIMELELIEPHLFFDLYPHAAVTFARELKKRLQ